MAHEYVIIYHNLVFLVPDVTDDLETISPNLYTGETFIMTHDKFNTIYPNYIDSTKTTKLGRRISTKDAVLEPTIQDIHEALASLNIRHVIQPHKGYSRDASARWFNNGRVLVDLKGANDDGVLGMGSDGAFDLDAMPDLVGEKENNEEGSSVSKKKFLKQLALIIKGLPGRQQRLEAKAQQLLEEEKAEKEAADSAAAKTPAAAIAGTVNKKKKGKKGKK